MYGYMGKILDVDLSSRSIKDVPLDEKSAQLFVGGSGLACKLMLDELGSSVSTIDPLSPQNLLIFMTGPLTGTRVINSGRFEVCAKSPMTGGWGEANCGGKFGPHLKFAGYDGAVIRGRAEDPLYLDISDEGPSLKEGAHLWGMGTYDAQKKLKEEIEGRFSSAVIGPAGERLFPIACIINDRGRAAGRCGMGAVMGSKNLKAVVARGKRKIEVKDRDGLAAVVDEALEIMNGEVSTSLYRGLGTSGYMETSEAFGDNTVKYYTQSIFEKMDEISGSRMNETALKKSYGCYGCSIGCGRIIETEELGETDGPEYETIEMFGNMCLNSDIGSIYRANELCNDGGIDTISMGSTIAFAMYLWEKGVITERETGGIDLSWGNSEAIVELVEKAIRGEGFGGLLARGSRSLGREYGVGDWAATVKGVEVPAHDPRGFFASACGYATQNRGAVHVPDQLYVIEMGTRIEEYGIVSQDRFQDEGKGELVAKTQNYFGLFDAATICCFSLIRPKHLAKMFKCVTGVDHDVDSLLRTGERIFNTKRIFNNLCGIGRNDDRLPEILLQPIEEGGTMGNVPNVEKQLKEYYEYRNWDQETGKPKREKIEELGLEGYAPLIW
jgi:aldehyde:ferredoxin oxidoreductase